jgi:hypothetical protein
MKRIIYVCFFQILFYACTTSYNNQDQGAAASKFSALTIVDKWVYRRYDIGNQGIDVPGNLYESISIVDTEIINEKLYYKFSRLISANLDSNGEVPNNGEHFEYYRDSLGYLVN